MLDPISFFELFAGELTVQRFEIAADNGGGQRLTGCRRDLLPGGKCFPRHAVVSTAAMFQYHKDSAHITRTSNFSFSTSFAAASLGEPSISCVSFFFSGRYTRSSVTVGAAACGRSPPVTRRTSLVFDFLMPMSVA